MVPEIENLLAGLISVPGLMKSLLFIFFIGIGEAGDSSSSKKNLTQDQAKDSPIDSGKATVKTDGSEL